MNRLFQAALAAVVFGCAPLAAHAAQSYDNCTGFITSLPVNIGTQGVWCMRHDVSTALATGYAINITANNVTIDCNDFKVGGLAAGDATNTIGIHASNRQNVTVRNCNVRGFQYGVDIQGGDGHLVEDNRIDESTLFGIRIETSSPASIVRRNRVIGTGGAPGYSGSYGIVAAGDIIDNTIDGQFSAQANGVIIGIEALSGGAEVSHNRVRGQQISATGWGVGIRVAWSSATIADNRIQSGPVLASGKGIDAHADAFCSGNTVSHYGIGVTGCQDAGGNASN
jgi:hypothetical protein